MADTPQLGLNFGIYVDILGTPTLVAGMTNVNVNRTKNIVDTSHAGNNGWTSSLAGLKSWGADLNAVTLVDDADGSIEASQAALEAAFESDDPVLIEVRRPGEVTGRSGLAHMADLTENNPADGRMEFSAQLSGTEALS